MRKVKTILQKEWAEVFRNRLVIFTVVFLPLVMTAIPLGVLYSSRGLSSVGGAASGTVLPPQVSQTLCPADLGSSECFQYLLVSEFMMLFMLIPVVVPVTIAAYSIVGEKTTHSLEPLLATPVTTIELLVGKALAAVLPAVLATFAAFGIFALGAWVLLGSRLFLSALFEARWVIAIFIVGPLLAIMAVIISLMVSSRVNEPRAAEQISMVVIVPVLVGFFGQMFGLFVLNRLVILIVALVMLLLDALLVYLAVGLFQRETILTRWK
jgi:ABC-2 type transport system permease protein